jgi:hypothetical protein
MTQPVVVDESTPAAMDDVDEDASCAPLQGVLLVFEVQPGQRVAAGATLAVIESMKMENLVQAPAAAQCATGWRRSARSSRPAGRCCGFDNPCPAADGISVGHLSGACTRRKSG